MTYPASSENVLLRWQNGINESPETSVKISYCISNIIKKLNCFIASEET